MRRSRPSATRGEEGRSSSSSQVASSRCSCSSVSSIDTGSVFVTRRDSHDVSDIGAIAGTKRLAELRQGLCADGLGQCVHGDRDRHCRERVPSGLDLHLDRTIRRTAVGLLLRRPRAGEPTTTSRTAP